MSTSSWGFVTFAQNTMLSKLATLFESGNTTDTPQGFIPSKHGFQNLLPQTSRDQRARQGKTMLI